MAHSKATQATEAISSLNEETVEEMSDEELVKLRGALKSLEGAVTDARKSLVDGEVKARTEPGESLLGLNHIESHNKFVSESPGAVIARAAAEGISWTEFVNINASKLNEVAPSLTDVGRRGYSYIR